MARLALLPLLLLAFFLPSAVARADTYCVTPATGCDGAHTLSTVQSALIAAASNAGSDTIQLGAATYTQDGMTYTGSDPVSIVGAGTGSTTLRRATAAPSSYVLRGTQRHRTRRTSWPTTTTTPPPR